MPDTLMPPTHKALGLTRRQADVIKHLYRHLSHKGRVPTLNDLGRSLGIQRTGVHHHVRALAEAGWLEVVRGNIRLKGVHMTPVFDATDEARRLQDLLGVDHG